MSDLEEKKFHISYVLSAISGRDLVVEDSKIIDGSRSTVLDFMVGKGLSLSDTPFETKIERIINNIKTQHPKLAKVNFDELDRRLDTIQFVSFHFDEEAHRESQQKAITALVKWTAEVAEEVGNFFVIAELDRKEYPRFRKPTTEDVRDKLQALTGNASIVLDEGSSALKTFGDAIKVAGDSKISEDFIRSVRTFFQEIRTDYFLNLYGQQPNVKSTVELKNALGQVSGVTNLFLNHDSSINIGVLEGAYKTALPHIMSARTALPSNADPHLLVAVDNLLSNIGGLLNYRERQRTEKSPQ